MFKQSTTRQSASLLIMRYSNQFDRLFLAASIVIVGSTTVVAQDANRHLPPRQIVIDEDILAALTDEPCHHFESARDQFVVGQQRRAAEHLRTASVYLQLEAARATARGRAALDTSIRELHDLAAAVEQGQVRSVETLQRTFARAHYALAGHHCVKTAHRCCQPAACKDKHEMARAGHDLRAATVHLKRGAAWEGNKLDEQARAGIDLSQATANKLIGKSDIADNEVQRAIGTVRTKLEGLTGRKLMLAPPLVEDDDLGPSIFR